MNIVKRLRMLGKLLVAIGVAMLVMKGLVWLGLSSMNRVFVVAALIFISLVAGPYIVSRIPKWMRGAFTISFEEGGTHGTKESQG